MHWEFRPLTPDEVETEVTQRDQFHDDLVGLSDTIVREVVQNSLDAKRDKKIVVSFSIRSRDDGIDPDFVNKLFRGQTDHAVAAGLDVSEIDFSQPMALVIEDFGTSGLTGSTVEKDEDHFSDFWRRHGRSHKSGKSGGRWGLGKLVYSMASGLRTFFGITVRADDPVPLLMGQSVLQTHKLNGTEYATHGFFAELKQDNPYKGRQLPLTAQTLIENFSGNFALRRDSSPGLSIVIPFPSPDLCIDDMIGVGIVNYFFPVLTDQLVLEFDGRSIDSSSLRHMAAEYASREVHTETDKLFDFVEEIHGFDRARIVSARPDWYRPNFNLAEDAFEESKLEELREAFGNHETIGVILPVTIVRKDGTERNSNFEVYLKRPEVLSRGMDMYVRGGITVPGEAKFRDRKGFGALIARDDPVAEFLGDAENAAHTKWNGRAEKLTGKYRNSGQTLKAVRNSVVRLYDILSQAVEEEEEEALLDFFWTPSEKGLQKKPGKKTPPTPMPEIEPQPKPFRVVEQDDGFSIRPADPIDADSIPLECRLVAAYDLVSKNPFSKYDRIDFDFSRKGEIEIDATGVTIESVNENRIDFSIDSPDFRLSVTGFDPERDVVVRVVTRGS